MVIPAGASGGGTTSSSPISVTGGEVGVPGRRCGHEHHGGRTTSKVPHDSFPVPRTGLECNDFGGSGIRDIEVHTRLVGERHCTGDDGSSNRSLFLQDVYRSPEEREEAPDFRPLCSKQAGLYPQVQDGNLGEDHKVYKVCDVGNVSGFNRRILSCSHSSRLPEVLCLQAGQEDICVSEDALWFDHGTLGILQSSEADKGLSPSSRGENILIPGRFSDSGREFSSFKEAHQLDTRSAGMVEFQDQQGEVFLSSSPEIGVFGCCPGFTEPNTFSSSRQGEESSVQLSPRSDRCVDDQERVGTTHWFPELHNLCTVAGEASFNSTNPVDELTHYRNRQGSSSSSRQRAERSSPSLAGHGVFETPGPNECPGSYFRSDDRRFRLWMEWGSPSLPGQWCLDTRGTLLFYKLEGTEGRTIGSPSFCEVVDGEICQGSFRQSGSIVMYPPAGLEEFSGSLRSFQRVVGILPRSPDFFGPCAHQGSLECACRSGFQVRSDFNGVVLGSSVFLLDLPSLQDSPGSGPFCYEGQFKIAFFHLPLSRRDGLSMGRPFPELESVWVSIRLPTTESSPRCSNETGTVSGFGLCNSSDVENTRLVSDIGRKVSDKGSSSQRVHSLSAHLQRSGSDGRAMEPLGMASVRSLSVSRMWSIDIPSLVKEVESVDSLVSRSSATQTHDQVLGIGSYPSHLKTNRLRAIAFGLRRKRFGKQAVDLILTQHRPSTCRQYQMVWDKFLDFLRVRGISHDEVGANSVADFLAYYAVSLRRAYRTVAGYKCAVAEPLYANFGISLETREIKALLRGVYARHPPPKDGLMPGWCLSDLLEYLRGPPFEPLETARWGALIKKTLVLFLLASGRRISEISEIQRVSCRKGNKVILKWLPLFRAKWESADFHPEQPSVSRLVPLPGEDVLLCPVRAWSVFVRKRMTIRNYVDNDRFWPCSMYALTYFCKRVVKDSVKFAGKSLVGPVGPHQFRKLAGSLSRKFFTDSERVLYNKMGSKSMSVLTRSYIRDVSRVRHSCVVPLGTLYPNARLVRDLPKKS